MEPFPRGLQLSSLAPPLLWDGPAHHPPCPELKGKSLLGGAGGRDKADKPKAQSCRLSAQRPETNYKLIIERVVYENLAKISTNP